MFFCLVARVAIRRTRSEPRLLTCCAEGIIATVAGEEPILGYRATVRAALLRGEACLPAWLTVPVAEQLGFCFLPDGAAISTVLLLRRVLWAARRVRIIAGIVFAEPIIYKFTRAFVVLDRRVEGAGNTAFLAPCLTGVKPLACL